MATDRTPTGDHERPHRHPNHVRNNPTVEAECKRGSCDATTATVYRYGSGGYRLVGCDGCGVNYKIPKSGEGPFREGEYHE